MSSSPEANKPPMGHFLERVEIFEGLTRKELDLLSANSKWQVVPERTLIIAEDDPACSLFVIERGQVEVYCSDRNGGEYNLTTLSAYDYFGELALIDDSTRSSSVRTKDECRICSIHKNDFYLVLQKHPDITRKLLHNLTRRVRMLTSDIKNLALNDVYCRVAHVLTSLSEERGDGSLGIPVTLSKQDIADRVGTSRETVTTILKALTIKEYIRFEDRHIVINTHLPLNGQMFGENLG